MKVKNGTNVALGDLLLVICVNKECKSNSVCAERGLNNVGNVVLVCLLVEEGEILAGVVTVLGKVVIGSVGNTPELAPTEGEEELEVGGCLGIEAKLLGIVVTKTKVLVLHTEVKKPLVAEVLPVCEPLKVGAGLAEELKLHLLKLSGSEYEVTGGNLVTEGLTNLADTEGKLLSCTSLHCGEVNEDTLCGLGTKIYGRAGLLGYTDEGLEHKVKLLNISEVGAAADRTNDVLLLNIGSHLLEGPGCRVVIKAVLECVILDKLICSVSCLTALAVHKGVGEAANVTGCYPGLGVHDNCRVKTHVVAGLLHELLPPSALYVVLELNAERTVVPGVSKTAVDLRAGEDEASVLTESNDFFHCLFAVFHLFYLYL